MRSELDELASQTNAIKPIFQKILCLFQTRCIPTREKGKVTKLVYVKREGSISATSCDT